MVYGGKTHDLPFYFDCHLFLSHQPLQCLGFVVGGVVMAELLRAVIAGGNMGKEARNSILSHSSIFSTTPFFPVGSLPRGGWFIPSRAWSFPPPPFSPWAVRSSRGRFICAHRQSCFSSHVGWDPHTERHSTLSSRTGALRWFFLTQGTGEIVAVTQDFWVQEPFLHSGVVCKFPY